MSTPERDVIGEFLARFSDQPYRQADVLIGRLDKAGYQITHTATDDENWRRIETERDRLRAVAVGAKMLVTAIADGDETDIADAMTIVDEKILALLAGYQLDVGEGT